MKGTIILRCKNCKEIIQKTTYKNVKWNGTKIIEFTPQELYDFRMIKHKCKKEVLK